MNMSDFLNNMCNGTGYAKINEGANTQIDEANMSFKNDQVVKDVAKVFGKRAKYSGLINSDHYWKLYNGCDLCYSREDGVFVLVDGDKEPEFDKASEVLAYVRGPRYGASKPNKRYLGHEDMDEAAEDDIEECGTKCNEEDSEATITVKGNKVIVTVDGEDIELTKEEAEGLGIDLEECGEAVQVENVARGATIATLDDDDEYKSVKTFVNESRGVTYKFLDSLDEGVTGEAELPETVNVGAMYSYKNDFYIVTGEVNGNVIMVNADGDEIQVPIQDFEQDAAICESEEDEDDYGDDIDEGVQPKGNSWEDVINMLDSKYGIPAIERSNGGLFVDGCHKVEAICKGNVRGWTLKINGENHTCRPSTNAICKCIANAINESAVNEGAFDSDAKALISKLAKNKCKAKLVKSNFDGYKLSARTKDGVAIEIEYDDNSGTYSVYDDASGETMDAYDEKELFTLI